MLEVRRLKLLSELKRKGTLAAVAAALHCSPSSVSQQLAQLEREVGVPLLTRVGRSVRLTEAAQLLAAHTDTILEQLAIAKASVQSFDTNVRGTVRIASFQTAILALVPQLLHELARFENLQVELAQLEPEFALPRLLDRHFDIVLGEEFPTIPEPIHPELNRVDLFQEPLWLATAGTARPDSAPALGNAAASRLGGLKLADLADAPWVMEPEGTLPHQWATRKCRLAGFEPYVRFESPDLMAHVAMIESGHAIGFLPDLLPLHLRYGIDFHPLLDEYRTVFMSVHQEKSDMPAIRAVRDTLRSVIAARHTRSATNQPADPTTGADSSRATTQPGTTPAHAQEATP